MCKYNTTIDTRKNVLRLIHDIAILKAKDLPYHTEKTMLDIAISRWTDELAQAHSEIKCSTCNHKFR